MYWFRKLLRRINMFDISEDKNIIDIIKGIAGTAKSSGTYPIITKRYNPNKILWNTGTHALRREAMERYPGIKCCTIAGGAFVTLKGCQWYAGFKDLSGIECIVFDEPFVADMEKIIEFCETFRGKMKIILLGDDHQMLAPGIGHKAVRLFNEFCEKDYVKVTTLTRTLRTTHDGVEDTKLTALYNEAYANVDNINICMQDKYKDAFPHITYEELIKKGFNPNDYYIPYTRECEESLYIDFDIKNQPNVQLIPKGNIASDDNAVYDPLNPKIPIVCQAMALRLNLTAYWQAFNIGTTNRMQGRQVPKGHKCYIVVPTYCKMTNRAFYTNITRCWVYDSIVIVDYESPKNVKLTKFMGEPIKEWSIMSVDDDINVKDGVVTQDIIDKYTNGQDTNEYVWRRDRLRIKGELYFKNVYEKPATRSTAKGLIKKSPELNINYIDDIYANIGHFFIMPSFIKNNSTSNYKYQMDLCSAFHHMLAYGCVPVSGKMYNKWYDDKLNFFEIVHSDILKEGSIVNEFLAAFLVNETNTKVQFAFGTDYEKGCTAGKELLAKAYKSKEDKKDTKGVHWGLFKRPYLTRLNLCYETGETETSDLGVKKQVFKEETHIVRDPVNVYEPLICSIQSYIFFVHLALRLKLFGRVSIEDGAILADAFYFNEDKIELVKDLFENGVDGKYHYNLDELHLDYRIFERPEGIDWDDKDNLKILYQSYKDLKTRRQITNKKYYDSHKKNGAH